MPITITLPTNNTVGPGISVEWQTDLIGPIPSDAFWVVRFSSDAEGDRPHYRVQRPAHNVNAGGTTIFVPLSDELVAIDTGETFGPGATVHVIAELHEPSGVVDSGAITTTWDPTVGLGFQAHALAGTSGGLTPTERQQLTDTERRTQLLGEPVDLVVQQPSGPLQTTIAQLFSRQSLDFLTLQEVTSGPTCEPVRAAVDFWYYAVIVRVTQIAEDLVPRTPDDQWYFPDLAVLRILRGADLQYRRGIHTPTFETVQPWQWGWPLLNWSLILGAPPDLTLMVDWRVGCCGQVFLTRLP